jgi:hypothetical protein
MGMDRAGSPGVEAAWHYDAASKKVVIDLTQTENGAAYRLPMEIALQSPGGPAKVEKVQFTGKEQHFDIAADQEPASVELDPNVWLLIDAKIAKK